MITTNNLTEKEKNNKSLNDIFDFVDYLFENIENHKQAIKDYKDLDLKIKSINSQPDNYRDMIKSKELKNDAESLLNNINEKAINPMCEYFGTNNKYDLSYKIMNLFTSVNQYTIKDCDKATYIKMSQTAKERYEQYRTATKNEILYRIDGAERLINYIEFGDGETPKSGLKFIFDWFVPENDFEPMYTKKQGTYIDLAETLKPFAINLTAETLEYIYTHKNIGNHLKPTWKKKRDAMRFLDWINEGSINKLSLTKFNELFEYRDAKGKLIKFKVNDNDNKDKLNNKKRENFLTKLESYPKPIF